MVTHITAQYNEDAIAKGLQEAGTDFQDLADNGRTVSVSVEQTGDGAVHFEVTLRTFAIGIKTAQNILAKALI